MFTVSPATTVFTAFCRVRHGEADVPGLASSPVVATQYSVAPARAAIESSRIAAKPVA